jgi:charged multivesicular body protein 1
MARIYATNAIRKRNEAVNFMRLSARFDSVASQISSAVTTGMVIYLVKLEC